MREPGERNIIERAFELASSGECATVLEIKGRLRRERFESIDAHLSGLGIRRRLKALLSGASSSTTGTDTAG
jgi:hypothetical protein